MLDWIKTNIFSRRAPILCVDRLRVDTDGEGITTLVLFYRCPLRCKYCVNKQCFNTPKWYNHLTAKHISGRIARDNIYFQSTGGGVTFGGGEPLLYPEFIADFRANCNPGWQINIETSLNVKQSSVERVVPFVKMLIVDVKDVDSEIYRSYTGASNRRVLDNLNYLAAVGAQSRVLIRIPLIKGYNTTEDQDRSEAYLRGLGYMQFERFEYLVK